MRWETYCTEDYVRLLDNLSEKDIAFSTTSSWNNVYTITADIPDSTTFRYTKQGQKEAESYIREIEAKRKEILDAKKDTVDDTNLPTIEDILDDICFEGLDEHGEYYNGWGVTDHYDSDYPLLLKLGRDILIAEH